MSDMECASYSVEPVCDEQFSSEVTAVFDTAGSDSSESLDDVTYDCDCPVYNTDCTVQNILKDYNSLDTFSYLQMIS